MDEDRAISNLCYYIDHILPAPPETSANDIREAAVYSRWAANEICERLIKESYILPETVSYIQKRTTSQIVDEFIDEMDTFAKMSETPKGRFIFSIAGDEARRVKAYIC